MFDSDIRSTTNREICKAIEKMKNGKAHDVGSNLRKRKPTGYVAFSEKSEL